MPKRNSRLALIATPPLRRRRLTHEKVIEALEKCRAITYAAEYLGVTDRALRMYLSRYPELRELADRLREQLLDEAELGLWEAVKRREQWAIEFSLKYLGRSRGYTTSATGGSGVNNNLEFRFVYVEPREATEPKGVIELAHIGDDRSQETPPDAEEGSPGG